MCKVWLKLDNWQAANFVRDYARDCSYVKGWGVNGLEIVLYVDTEEHLASVKNYLGFVFDLEQAIINGPHPMAASKTG